MVIVMGTDFTLSLVYVVVVVAVFVIVTGTLIVVTRPLVTVVILSVVLVNTDIFVKVVVIVLPKVGIIWGITVAPTTRPMIIPRASSPYRDTSPPPIHLASTDK